jgi:hypothetical protein
MTNEKYYGIHQVDEAKDSVKYDEKCHNYKGKIKME